MKRLAIPAALCAALLLGSCAGFEIMPHHNMKAIMDLKETKTEAVSLEGRQFVLLFVGDAIQQPLGALFIPDVVQEYALEAPGYVLFEKIAGALQEEKATVAKVYLNRDRLITTLDPQATVVTLMFENLEMHQYKTDKEAWYLGKMSVTYSVSKNIRDARAGAPKKITVSVKVPVAKDVLKELALNFSTVLAKEVM
jgi:hypothetical protein